MVINSELCRKLLVEEALKQINTIIVGISMDDDKIIDIIQFKINIIKSEKWIQYNVEECEYSTEDCKTEGDWYFISKELWVREFHHDDFEDSFKCYIVTNHTDTEILHIEFELC